MGEEKQVTQKILNYALQIICLLTGEDYLILMKHNENDTDRSQLKEPGGPYGTQNTFMKTVVKAPTCETNHDRKLLNEKILALTNKIADLLTIEEPAEFDEVAVYFSKEEWDSQEDEQNDLHKDVMLGNCQILKTLGHSSMIPEIVPSIKQTKVPCESQKQQNKKKLLLAESPRLAKVRPEVMVKMEKEKKLPCVMDPQHYEDKGIPADIRGLAKVRPEVMVKMEREKGLPCVMDRQHYKEKGIPADIRRGVTILSPEVMVKMETQKEPPCVMVSQHYEEKGTPVNTMAGLASAEPELMKTENEELFVIEHQQPVDKERSPDFITENGIPVDIRTAIWHQTPESTASKRRPETVLEQFDHTVDAQSSLTQFNQQEAFVEVKYQWGVGPWISSVDSPGEIDPTSSFNGSTEEPFMLNLNTTYDETREERKRRLARERKQRWKAKQTPETWAQIRFREAERRRRAARMEPDLSLENNTIITTVGETSEERKRRLAKERKERWKAKQTPETWAKIRSREAERRRCASRLQNLSSEITTNITKNKTPEVRKRSLTKTRVQMRKGIQTSETSTKIQHKEPEVKGLSSRLMQNQCSADNSIKDETPKERKLRLARIRKQRWKAKQTPVTLAQIRLREADLRMARLCDSEKELRRHFTAERRRHKI